MPDAFAPGPSHPAAEPLFAGAALLDAGTSWPAMAWNSSAIPARRRPPAEPRPRSARSHFTDAYAIGYADGSDECLAEGIVALSLLPLRATAYIAAISALRCLANAGRAPRQRSNGRSINGGQRRPRSLSCYLFS
jgi:hypothetical protein